ncbi:hypothetical protein ACTFIY_011770 [Dictyostelium cf. discoideum]
MNYEEEIFWKVIKNKLLFKIIIKFINYKDYSISYFPKSSEFPPQHSIEWLICNNKKSILEYKIKNHHYLALGKSTIYGKFYKIFSIFSNDEYDPILYRSLIYMFSDYFSPLSKDLQDRINEAIESNNLNVLKVMCDPNGQCKHKPTVNDYILSLKNNRFKIALWIGETFPGIHHIFEYSKLKSTQLFGTLFKFIDNYKHRNEVEFNRFTLFQIIKNLLNNCQFSYSVEHINNMEILKQNLFNVCPIKNGWSIENLINSSELILKFNNVFIKLKDENENENENLKLQEDFEFEKQQKEKEKNEQNEKNEKLKIKLFSIKFSNYQKCLLLKNEIKEFSIKLKIRKLLKIYLSSLDTMILDAIISNEPLYKSCYAIYDNSLNIGYSQDDDDDDDDDDDGNGDLTPNEQINIKENDSIENFHCNSHLEALKNGDFLLLKKWFNENQDEIPLIQLLKDLNTISIFSKEPLLIFSNCNGNDSESKSKRLDFIIYLLYESDILQDHLLNPWLLFCLILKFKDYELIEMVFNNLSEELIKAEKNSIFNQYRDEYLNLGNLVNNENTIKLIHPYFPWGSNEIANNTPFWNFKEWSKNGRVDLFEVIESFVPKDYRIVYSLNTEIGFYGNELLCLLNSLSKPHLYEIPTPRMILFKVDEETTTEDIGFIKLIITEISDQFEYCFTNLKKGGFEIIGENFVQFFNWFFSNRQNDITSNRFVHPNKKTWLMTMKYISGGEHFNEYFKTLNPTQFFENEIIKNQIFDLVAKFGDIHFIDKIIKYYFNGIFPLVENNYSITDSLYRLILSTISNGHLKLLEYFNLNFKSTFFKSSLFNQIKLNIINNNQLEFSQYILNLKLNLN